jgi:hypothetical protein
LSLLSERGTGQGTNLKLLVRFSELLLRETQTEVCIY